MPYKLSNSLMYGGSLASHSELLCSKNAIRNALLRNGIPIRSKEDLKLGAIRYGSKLLKGLPVEYRVEQKMIQSIVWMRKEGMSYDKIASILTKMGIPTKTRRRKWNGACVRAIFLKGLPT